MAPVANSNPALATLLVKKPPTTEGRGKGRRNRDSAPTKPQPGYPILADTVVVSYIDRSGTEPMLGHYAKGVDRKKLASSSNAMLIQMREGTTEKMPFRLPQNTIILPAGLHAGAVVAVLGQISTQDFGSELGRIEDLRAIDPKIPDNLLGGIAVLEALTAIGVKPKIIHENLRDRMFSYILNQTLTPDEFFKLLSKCGSDSRLPKPAIKKALSDHQDEEVIGSKILELCHTYGHGVYAETTKATIDKQRADRLWYEAERAKIAAKKAARKEKINEQPKEQSEAESFDYQEGDFPKTIGK